MDQSPKDFKTIRILSTELGIPVKRLQIIANMLRIKKDSTGIYVFDKEGVEQLKRFLTITNTT